MKKIYSSIKIIIIFLAIILIACSIVNSIYLFNPFTFKRDSITPRDWHDYRTPIEVVYYYGDTTKGWTELNKVKDKKEAIYIIKQLKKANEIKYSKKDYFIPIESRGREYKVVIRRPIGNSTYLNLMQFDFFDNGDIIELGNTIYIKLTKEIQELLLNRLSPKN